jgi:hypothetical protein
VTAGVGIVRGSWPVTRGAAGGFGAEAVATGAGISLGAAAVLTAAVVAADTLDADHGLGVSCGAARTLSPGTATGVTAERRAIQ